MPLSVWVDFVGSLLVLGILGWTWWAHFRYREPKLMWQCVRYQGGGTLKSPTAMTVQQVTQWLGRDKEVAYIDQEHGFIFYRQKG